MSTPTPQFISPYTIGTKYNILHNDGGGLLPGEHHPEWNNAIYLGINKYGSHVFKTNNTCIKTNDNKCSNACVDTDDPIYAGICACMTLTIGSREGWYISPAEK